MMTKRDGWIGGDGAPKKNKGDFKFKRWFMTAGAIVGVGTAVLAVKNNADFKGENNKY